MSRIQNLCLLQQENNARSGVVHNTTNAGAISLFLLRCKTVSSPCKADHSAMSAPEFLSFCKHLVSPYGLHNITLERSTIIHALYYMSSLMTNRRTMTGTNECATCVLVTCFVIATKFVQENGRRSNFEWTQLANMELKELNVLEQQVLTRLGFDLFLSLTKFDEFERLLTQDSVVSSWTEGPINKPHDRCDGSSFCCGSNSRAHLVVRSECTTPMPVNMLTCTSESQSQYPTPSSAANEMRKISTVLEYNQILRQLRLC